MTNESEVNKEVIRLQAEQKLKLQEEARVILDRQSSEGPYWHSMDGQSEERVQEGVTTMTTPTTTITASNFVVKAVHDYTGPSLYPQRRPTSTPYGTSIIREGVNIDFALRAAWYCCNSDFCIVDFLTNCKETKPYLELLYQGPQGSFEESWKQGLVDACEYVMEDMDNLNVNPNNKDYFKKATHILERHGMI